LARCASSGLKVRRPEKTFATMDHAIPTRIGVGIALWPSGRGDAGAHVAPELRGLRHHPVGHRRADVQGIVHVVGPEMGVTQPGMTIVCGDSHTSTHGAFGALAFGIGTSEVGHVLATQCLLQNEAQDDCHHRRWRSWASWRHGQGHHPRRSSPRTVRAAAPATSSSIAAAPSASLSMANRMTICNMSIEGGARAGMIAPDDDRPSTIVKGRPYAPQGEAMGSAPLTYWQTVLSPMRTPSFDRGAACSTPAKLQPMITYGTNPGAGHRP
jgi:3-isopropylmalate/(R)-2-methylmalate dehydratase large subunit